MNLTAVRSTGGGITNTLTSLWYAHDDVEAGEGMKPPRVVDVMSAIAQGGFEGTKCLLTF